MYRRYMPNFENSPGSPLKMLAEASVLADVLTRFIDWCGEDYEIFSWSDSDIWQIMNETRLKNLTDLPGLTYV